MTTNATHRSFITRLQYPFRLLLPLLSLLLWHLPLIAQTPTAPHRPAQSPTSAPHWIWVTAPADTPRILQHTLPLQSAPATAQLRIAADFCTAEVFLNDIAVCTIGPNAPTLDLDVTQALKSGTNSIRLQLHASNGPAAVALSLTAQDLAGLHTLNSDRSWTTDPATTLSDLGPVPAELWGLGRTSIALSSADNYEQWRQASKPANPDSAAPAPAPTPTEITDARLRIAPGFQIQRIRTAAAEIGRAHV